MLHPSSIGKKTVFVFLLLFLLTSLVTAAHHHDDGKCHDQDCSMCAAGSLVFSVPSSPFSQRFNMLRSVFAAISMMS